MVTMLPPVFCANICLTESWVTYRNPSTFVETSDLKSSAVKSVNGLVKKMPALLTSTSTDLKRDSAVSTILAAVAGSPMWPSTRATWLEATTSVDWVTLRELATTLKPRSKNAFTIPAPIPCDAPVTIAVFLVLLMIVCLETDFSHVRGWSSRSEIRVKHDTVTRLACFKSGKGLVDIAHREVLGLRRDIVP